MWATSTWAQEEPLPFWCWTGFEDLQYGAVSTHLLQYRCINDTMCNVFVLLTLNVFTLGSHATVFIVMAAVQAFVHRM